MFELIDMLIVRPITNVLFVVYGFVGDFGLAIILFTLLVKICIWPLMKRQLDQTRLMRKIQPELAEIKKNCNGNRQLESLQMMDLYKRNNIKPFRSILTLIIQLPIFIALYTAVRVMVVPTTSDNLALRAYPGISEIGRVEEVIHYQDEYFADLEIYNTAKESDPEADIAAPEYKFHPKLFGLVDLDVKPGFTSFSAFVMLLFALGSAFTQYLVSRQQLPSKKAKKSFRQLMKEAASGKEPDQSEINEAMSGQMSFMMPAMMFIIMINLPGALVFYYGVSNIMTVIQQKYVLGKKSTEMEISADKRIIKELKHIEEAQVVESSPKIKTSTKNGAHITHISVDTSKKKRRKK